MLDLDQIDAAAKETRQNRREEFKSQAEKIKTDRQERRQARRARYAVQQDSVADLKPA